MMHNVPARHIVAVLNIRAQAGPAPSPFLLGMLSGIPSWGMVGSGCLWPMGFEQLSDPDNLSHGNGRGRVRQASLRAGSCTLL